MGARAQPPLASPPGRGPRVVFRVSRDGAREGARDRHRPPRRRHPRDRARRDVRLGRRGGRRGVREGDPRSARSRRRRGVAPPERLVQAQLLELGHRERVHEPDERRDTHRAERLEPGHPERLTQRALRHDARLPRRGGLRVVRRRVVGARAGARRRKRRRLRRTARRPARVSVQRRRGVVHAGRARVRGPAPLGAVDRRRDKRGGDGKPRPGRVVSRNGGLARGRTRAPRPRFAATSTVRDLVRFVSLPVDTDFSVFADPTLRNLPGVDIASMLGGTTYHTDKDVVSRVREGSVQAYGENVAKGANAVARALLKRTGGRRHDPRAEPATRAGESGAFFDVYFLEGFAIDSRGASALLHAAPLLACIVDFALGGASRRASYASGVRVSAKSFALTLAAPALLGAARAVVSGKPLAWFGRPALAAALFAPPALVATLLPYADAQLKHGPIARLDGRAARRSSPPRSPRFSASRTPPSRRSSRRTRSARRSSCSPSPRASPSGRRSSRWRCSPPASRSPRPSRRSRRPSSPKRWASPARSPGRSDSRSGTSSWASRSGSASTSSE